MTQLRNDPGALSNWFDVIKCGVGGRRHGAGFFNVDGLYITHERCGHRYLFEEYKQPHERALDAAVREALLDLAQLPRVTVWIARRLNDRHIQFEDCARPGAHVITVEEYRRTFQAWRYALDPIAGTLYDDER